MKLNLLIKQINITILCIFLLEVVFAIDYKEIVNHVNKTPTTATRTTQTLSTYLCKPYRTEVEKFASIYYWIAKNVSYNHALAAKPLYYENIDEIINHVMQKRNGVCQHYSELFAQLCQHAGLTAYVVGGYTRTKDKVDELSHAWNIFKVANKWYFADATWARSGTLEIKRNQFPKQFFMITPKENIQHKMPFDPIWQALSQPVKYQEFDRGLINELKNGNYNYQDSILKHVKLDQANQYKALIRRIKNNGTHNRLVKKEYELMKENYKMLLYNKDVDRYNTASTHYNKGMQFYNHYARLKNNKTSYLKKTKKQLLGIIDSSVVNLEKANVLFNTIDGEPEMRSYIIKSKRNIEKIGALMRKEKKFVKDNFN